MRDRPRTILGCGLPNRARTTCPKPRRKGKTFADVTPLT